MHAPVDARSPEARPVRVLHFVTGGFSGGATQIAIALTQAGVESPEIEPLLVLRRKRRTDPRRIAELEQAGVPLRVVPGWSHAATIWSLVQVCREFKPDVLIAHGFSEHLWGRYAGLLAKVPHLVHVEHNTRERYTAWRLKQSRWLAQRTDRIVGCSEGVKDELLAQGMPPERTIAIPNGVRLAPFENADAHPLAQRIPGIVMVARLSKQKDHATLIRAVAHLRDRGHVVPVLFAGGGKKRHLAPLEQLVRLLGLQDQVRFLGVARNVPELLLTHRIAVLSTHWEGMPLALIEGMAAGCAVVGTAVPGVREVIDDGVDGRLVPENDDVALADVLQDLLTNDAEAARLGAGARRSAREKYGRELMHQRYEALCLELAR
ncbi:glycosyltransferase [Noviluteimonas gilva]|uniref:Glycosyltransferase n=1 Tax=Noviluteimonas gilva TaxID=2682097 RepID=A0A7C9HQZ1_9GAMM|nr:glycosyltransferase [Lysobacter gilvus]MUV13331.1 glycosyltransferase [Lysobacter gilvus]